MTDIYYREVRESKTEEQRWDVDCYFRDSHNSSSLYLVLGRSWKHDVKLVFPKDSRDPETGLVKASHHDEVLDLQRTYYEDFLKEIDQFDEKLTTWYKDKLAKNELYPDDDLDSLNTYFREKLDHWLALQRSAIDNGHILYWSV